MVRKDLEPSPERVAIMQWTARMGAITDEALADRLDVSVNSARGQLQVLQKAGWLSRSRPLAEQPALYTATRAGLRTAGLQGLDSCRVSASNANHLIVCARVAAALERCYPDHLVLGERELRRDERERGFALASTCLGMAPDGGPLLHRPDLVLWPQALEYGDRREAGRESASEGERRDGGRESHGEDEPGDRLESAREGGRPGGREGGLPISIEVELTVKAPQRLADICRAWARCRAVAGVIYFAPPEVERALRRAIDRAQADERLVVLSLDALPQSEA